ncbi:hypothetical protein QBC46DRAFT_365287 [Diplogelasinospora grovesii]|uniref:Rhodopsin domain-containing protein n=1 Tax=Diplogelasinospora grovesii TaxID=303347 RepID=A0AAN6S3Q5_9PEZI|nr:hypothetical protein QBC46DRAFT_365287 [Diplogelasinospora grovesii]
MASASAPANYTTGNVTIPANSTFWPPIPDDTRRSLQPDIIACACVTWLIAVTFVALRFYTRGKLIHVLGPTDWCIIPALLCAAGVSVSSIEQAVRGAGLHSWQLDLTQFSALERAAWYGIVFYSLSLTFTRISILLLYRRIFTYSWAKRAIRITLILVITLGLWFIASILTACVPLTAFWDWSLFFTTHVYCQPVQIWWLNAALNIVSDIVIMAVPMPVLSTLKLPKRQKIALVGVFGLGFFVCVVSILRLITLVHVEESNPWDSTYTSAQLIFWTAIEVNTAVSCACIMTLKPLIAKVFPRLLSTSQYFRDQSLAWITPISHPRNSRQSFNTRSGISHPHARNQSAMSECASKRGCDLLPRVYEAEGDLEAAQRADKTAMARTGEVENRNHRIARTGPWKG